MSEETSNNSSNKNNNNKKVLNNIHKLVKEATNKAIKNSSLELPFSDLPQLGDIISKENILPPWNQNRYQHSNNNDDDDNEIEPTKSSIDQEINDETTETLNSTECFSYVSGDESFEIGLALFGGSGVEKELLKQLNQSGDEIQSLLQNQRIGDDDEVQHQAKILSSKIKFLKKYYQGRIFLEDSSSCNSSDELVKACKILSKAKDIVKDMDTMIAIQERMLTADDEELKSGQTIVAAFRSQIRRLHGDYCSDVASLMDACLIITEDSIMVKENDKVGLPDAFDALMALSTSYCIHSSKQGGLHLLKDTMKALCLKLYKDVLQQFMEWGKWEHEVIQYQFREITDQVGESDDNASAMNTNAATTLKWRIRRDASTETAENKTGGVSFWLDTIDAISKILKFTLHHILFQRSELCNIMGEFLFVNSCSAIPITNIPPAFGENNNGKDNKNKNHKQQQWKGPLIRKLLSIFYHVCIPNEESSLSHLKEIITLLTNGTLEFEEHCLKFMPDTNDEHFPLSLCVDSLQENYGQKRRIVALSHGRSILLNEDFYNTILVGTKQPATIQDSDMKGMYPDNLDPDFILTDKARSFFTLPQCSISIVASNLMKLCRKTLEEAVSSSSSLPTTAHMLYRTSRDILDLYRTLIPAAYGSDIATTPRTAAICHNDCVFFAHHLLTLGLEYQQKFSTPNDDNSNNANNKLSKICTFVDLVPLFREMAEQVMVDMISRQKSQIQQLLQQLKGLNDALRSNEAVMEWMEVEKTIRAVNYHLHHLSQSWRTPILSFDIYGRTMGVLVDTLLYQILDQILHTSDISEAASHFVSSLFADVMHSCSQIFSPIDQQKQFSQDIDQYCNNWERFSSIRKCMDMSLEDITLALSEGVFRSLTSQELSKLICAAFDDTLKRRNILKVLEKVDMQKH